MPGRRVLRGSCLNRVIAVLLAAFSTAYIAALPAARAPTALAPTASGAMVWQEVAMPAHADAPPSIASPPTEQAGDILLARGRYVAAIRTLEAVQPQTAAIHNKIGIANEHMAMYPQARAQFEAAVAMDPKFAEAFNNLGTVFHAEGDFRDAEKLYKKAIHLKPRGADAYQNLGSLYYARGKFHKGDVAYKRAILLDRDVLERTAHDSIPTRDAQSLIEVHYHLARNCALAGQNPLALTYLHKAVVDGFHDTTRLLQEEAFTDLRKTPGFAALMDDLRHK